MPYSGASDSGLPDYVKKLSDKQKRQWVSVFNSAYARAKGDGKDASAAESFAFANANGVVVKKSDTQIMEKFDTQVMKKSDMQKEVLFKSVDQAERIVYGVVMEPTADGDLGKDGLFAGKVEKVDAHEEFTTAPEIRVSMIKFMEEFSAQKQASLASLTKEEIEEEEIEKGVYNLQHSKLEMDVALIENFIAPVDMTLSEGGETIRKGSWVQGTKIYSDALWAGVLAGTITGYSIEGTGYKAEIAKTNEGDS